MAKHLRGLNEAVLNFLDVRAADSASGYPEEHFSFTDFWNGKRLDDDLPFAAVHTGAHLSVRLLRRGLRSDMCNRLAHDLRRYSAALFDSKTRIDSASLAA